jgi:hypothetical protein
MIADDSEIGHALSYSLSHAGKVGFTLNFSNL